LFHNFVSGISDPKARFFIPIVVINIARQELALLKVIPTQAQWFGVTYKDAPI